MTATQVLYMLLGSALVAVGVLASALADRIRGLRVARDSAPRERANRAHSARSVIPVVEVPELHRAAPPRQPRAQRAAPNVNAGTEGDDVIAALVLAGYKKPIATDATWACSTAERATVESWMTAALQRCARGRMS